MTTTLDSDKLRAKGLSRYQIRGRLGKGGSAVVYDAYDSKLQREVALKIIENTQGENFVATAQDEAICAAKVLHPNVIQIYDFGVSDDGSLVYISMEKVVGFPLKEVLDAVTYLTVPEGIAVGIRICSALQAMHQLGIVHRDIKPANIMIRPAMHVTLVDFGIAKFKKPSPDTTGRVILQGTPLYMSPETCRGQATTALSDVYALGVVLYALFLGTHFIYRNNPRAEYEDILRAHLVVDPNPLCELIPGFPAQLSNIVARAMAKDPAARWPSALEMGQALIAYEKEFLEECRVQRLAPTLRDLVALTRAKRSAPRNPASAVERITLKRLPDSVPDQPANRSAVPVDGASAQRVNVANTTSATTLPPESGKVSRPTVPNVPAALRRAGVPMPSRFVESEPPTAACDTPDDEPTDEPEQVERVAPKRKEGAPTASLLERLDAIPIGDFVRSAVVLSVLLAVPIGVLVGRTSAAHNGRGSSVTAVSTPTTDLDRQQVPSASSAAHAQASLALALPELSAPETSQLQEAPPPVATTSEPSAAPTARATPLAPAAVANTSAPERAAALAPNHSWIKPNASAAGADSAPPKPVGTKGAIVKAQDASQPTPFIRRSIY